MTKNLMNINTYNPSHLIDSVKQGLRLDSDRALCEALRISPPSLSKIRNKQIPVGGSVLIKMHEKTGISIRKLRALMGDNRINFY